MFLMIFLSSSDDFSLKSQQDFAIPSVKSVLKGTPNYQHILILFTLQPLATSTKLKLFVSYTFVYP